MVQWLRFCTPNRGGPGSIPGQGTRSRMPQVKIPHVATKDPATKISRAVTKTQRGQINKYQKKKKKKTPLRILHWEGHILIYALKDCSEPLSVIRVTRTQKSKQ